MLSPDFNRSVHCILGLPIDTVDEGQVVDIIRRAAGERRRCFLSTPNLNFAVASLNDPVFRDSVLHSDLNTADGMPIVWIARLLGVPLPGRAAGSSIFERLRGAVEPPLRVYFLGGPEGVAGLACERINQKAGGIRCVGFESPGFGSVEEMSSPELITRINASGADFVVVSLGAKKGQEWIERNRERIEAPVISHLGAVVNFVAGTVRRAPRLVQALGLEWLWRVAQEPALWRRYASDGAALLRLLFVRVLPYAWCLRTSAANEQELAAARVESFEQAGQRVLRLSGAWSAGNLDPLRLAFGAAASASGAIHLDLTAVSHLDSAAIGQICLLRGVCGRSRAWSVSGAKPAVLRLLRFACADYLVRAIAPAGEPTSETLAC